MKADADFSQPLASAPPQTRAFYDWVSNALHHFSEEPDVDDEHIRDGLVIALAVALLAQADERGVDPRELMKGCTDDLKRIIEANLHKLQALPVRAN